MAARTRGYALWSLEDWLSDNEWGGEPAIIVRHDVDQHPRSVLPMLSIERRLGVRSTWYFRWRTASKPIIDEVRAAGGQVGLHYETLTRLIRARGLDADHVDGQLIGEARELLRSEIAAFKRVFGPIRSVCPHGDSRVPGVTNKVLLEDQNWDDYGIDFDGNEAINQFPLALWLTDRSVPDGRWKDGIDPYRVLDEETSPVLLVIHPNNWCSGVSLWRDRMMAAVLPSVCPGAGKRKLLARTGEDDPPPLPLLGARRAGSARITGPGSLALALQREVLRFNYEDGKSLTDRSGLNTLATNANLAESRAAMLEYALREAGLNGLEDLRVLDLGCGFGALALVFAARGASVLALDPKSDRMQVGRAVAELHGLPVRFLPGAMQKMELAGAGFDVAVMNNSLCYVVPWEDRQEALRRTFEALRPGGAVVIRNPNRLHPRDQFTGIPLLSMLPPVLAEAAAKLLGRHRSHVRLLTNGAARRELRAAGFCDVRSVRRPGESRLRGMLTGYQHLTARRPW